MTPGDGLVVLRDLAATVSGWLPAIGIGVLLLATGWVVGKLLAVVGRIVVERLLDRLARREAIATALDASGARAFAPGLVGALVFWVVLLLFVVAAVELLGLPILTDLFGRLAAYAPNILAAVALVVGGLVVGRLVRGWVARAATVMRLEHHVDAMSGGAQALVVGVAGVMALEQLGLQGRLLELVFAVVLASVLAAGGLAFALGARTAVANIVAARYVAQLVAVGQRIRIEGIEGEVVQITSTAVVVEGPEGRTVIPAARFHEGCPVLLEGP